MERPERTHDIILTRFIGPEKGILEFLRETEERYNIRLYPSPPDIDTRYPGCVRIYCHIPLDRSPTEKEVVDDD